MTTMKAEQGEVRQLHALLAALDAWEGGQLDVLMAGEREPSAVENLLWAAWREYASAMRGKFGDERYAAEADTPVCEQCRADWEAAMRRSDAELTKYS